MASFKWRGVIRFTLRSYRPSKVSERERAHIETQAQASENERHLRGVASQLEDLGGQVLQHGSTVHGGGGTNTAVGGHTGLEETVDTTDRELRCR